MKKIFVFVFALLLLCGCETKKTEIKDVTFKSYDEKFEVTVNSNWKETGDKGELNENADIEIYDASNQKYLIALMESKKDIPWTYEEYRDYILEKEAEAYKFDVKDKKSMKYGEADIDYVPFVTEIDGMNFYMSIYVIETKNYYGQIILWTKASQKGKVDEEFSKIVQSFKEIEEEVKE